MSFDPPADSPFRSRSYPTFVTDQELQQARAEMEECYRRRARRVGLQDVINMTIEEMEAELRETNEAIRKRRRGTPGLLLKPLWMLTVVACLARNPVEAFTAYDCTNRSNVVEAYSLLEPDACANIRKDGEVETTVYGEIVQIKQDRMIPVFRCTVIETLVAHIAGCFQQQG